MANCKKNPARRARRAERNERLRRALLELPDFAVRLLGEPCLLAARPAVVVRHWHD